MSISVQGVRNLYVTHISDPYSISDPLYP